MPDTAISMNEFIRYFHQSTRFYHVIVDIEGNCKYINPLFLQWNGFDIIDAEGMPFSAFIALSETEKYKNINRQCINNPGKNIAADFHHTLADGTTKLIKWEFQTLPEDDGGQTLVIQAMGISLPEIIEGKTNFINNGLGAERYKAYESGAEGLWRLDLDIAAPIQWPVDKLIDHFKEYSQIAECNDNMAQMYGLGKGENMVGMRLDSFMKMDEPAHAELMQKFVRNGFKISNAETQETDIHGNKLYIINNITGIIENGMLKRIWGTQQNITERKKADEQLLRSELFYKNLIADSLDGILLTDTNGTITFASPPIEKILGFKPDEVVGTNAFEYVHPQDQVAAQSAFQDEVRMEPLTKFIDIRIKNKFGEWVYCNVRGHNMLYNPYVNRMMIYFQDYTQRKKTETALKETESRIRSQALLLNNVSDIIVTVDVNNVITSWNSRTEETTGILANDAIGKNYREVIPLDFSPYTREEVAAMLAKDGVWRGEASFFNLKGEKQVHLHSFSLLHNEHGIVQGVLAVGKDITERKEMEARLQKSESFYRNLIANSLDGILLADKQGRITYCGDSVVKLSGYQSDDIVGKTIFEFVHPSDLSRAAEAFLNEITIYPEHSYQSLRLKRADGSWVWCIVRAHNLFYDPAVNALVIYFTDDTRRKEAEEKLKESENSFRLLLNNLSTGVILIDSSYNILLCNKAGHELFGISEKELLQRNIFHGIHEVIHENGMVFKKEEYPVLKAIKTKKPVHDTVIGVINEKNKKRVWLLMNAEPVFDFKEEIKHVICSFSDITEQKRLTQALFDQEVNKQKQLTQATIDGQEKERKEIGKELHDNINQHLTTTRLYLELAVEKATGEAKEMVSQAHQNIKGVFEEIRRLSQSLVPPTLGDIGLIESIQDILSLLKKTHTFTVEFKHKNFSEELLPDNMKLMFFRIIQEQINNILRHSQAQRVKLELSNTEQYAEMVVYDDGVGFDTSERRKGLGLTNMINRAALFNGHVTIESSPGNGCKIKVTIPLNIETV